MAGTVPAAVGGITMTRFNGHNDASSFQFSLARATGVLDAEEERALARRFRDSGDRHAAQRLVRAHLRTVLSLATRYRRYGVPLDELVSEGNLGLVIALQKFDPERGVRFVTYATHWVRAKMLSHVIGSRSVVAGQTGPLRPQLFFRFRRERARAALLSGDRERAVELLAERLNLPVERVEEMERRLDCREVSLDVSAPESSALREVELLQADASNPEHLLLQSRRVTLLSSAVGDAVRSLDPREQYIVENRLMAASEDELGLAEIGRNLGISRERARQLETRAKRKLLDHIRVSAPSELPASYTPPANDSPAGASPPRKAAAAV